MTERTPPRARFWGIEAMTIDAARRLLTQLSARLRLWDHFSIGCYTVDLDLLATDIVLDGLNVRGKGCFLTTWKGRFGNTSATCSRPKTLASRD
jgi:hypothetical protein